MTVKLFEQEDKDVICDLYHYYKYSVAELARQFGTSRRTIDRILIEQQVKRYRNWETNSYGPAPVSYGFAPTTKVTPNNFSDPLPVVNNEPEPKPSLFKQITSFFKRLFI